MIKFNFRRFQDMSKRPSPEKPTVAPQSEFDNSKVYRGGILGLMALRAVKGKSGALSEGIAKRIIDKDSTVAGREVAPETMTKVEATVKQTEYWHGTGRYQYRDSKVVDVLKGMIEQGGLLPQRDDIDLVGAMESVSLARSRTYARAYADIHENGEKGERHGSALLWSAAFIGPLALKIAQEEKVWRSENRQRVKNHFATSNSARWYEKVRQEPTGTLGIFAKGSDIEDNYPILFGIKEGIVTPTKTSESVAIHEVRSTEPVGFNGLTHIEVPASRVLETQAMLTEAGYEVPVMAIEDFEAYAARQSFTEQVS
jgi:hypothetical protein